MHYEMLDFFNIIINVPALKLERIMSKLSYYLNAINCSILSTETIKIKLNLFCFGIGTY